MLESVPGTIYTAKCNRRLVCRYKSEKLYVGGHSGITEVDYVPVGCIKCKHIFTINMNEATPPDHCLSCKGKLYYYFQTGANIPKGTYLCPKCEHQSLEFELSGFIR